MTELFAPLDDVEICYETFGDERHQPLLLIMGLGAPMTWWDERFCGLLAERGFRVIRFDNRDTGRSSRMHGRVDLAKAALLRRCVYSLEDLAGDAAGLLSHLGIEAAHVVGASMGGMVAQLLAIRHSSRVRSLTSIMSTTGSRLVGWATPQAVRALLTTPPTERSAYIEHHMATFRHIASPAYPPDEHRLRRRAEVTFDRGLNRAGTARQFAAILAAADRTSELRTLRLPATVIHGASDPLVNVSGGLATARAIPGAELHVMNGMGHDIPAALWTRFADFIEQTATTQAPR